MEHLAIMMLCATLKTPPILNMLPDTGDVPAAARLTNLQEDHATMFGVDLRAYREEIRLNGVYR